MPSNKIGAGMDQAEQTECCLLSHIGCGRLGYKNVLDFHMQRLDQLQPQKVCNRAECKGLCPVIVP
eukprot:1619284-Ditylum_brightwellii.AAC.1